MLSYKYDLSAMEQTKLDALIDGKDMENKVVLLVCGEFEIVDKTMFDKMNEQVFEFEEDACEVVSDIHFCELLKVYADCATLIFADNTIHHVDMHLAICIYIMENLMRLFLTSRQSHDIV